MLLKLRALPLKLKEPFLLIMSLWAGHTSLLCRRKSLFRVLRFFVVKKHCALHLHPQGSLTLRGGVHQEMCAVGYEEKAKMELCYFVLLAIFPETHRRRVGSGHCSLLPRGNCNGFSLFLCL